LKLDSAYLPPEMAQDLVRASVLLPGGLVDILGETALVDYGGKLCVLTRATSAEPYLRIRLDSATPPRLEEDGLNSAVVVTRPNGERLTLPCPLFDVETVREFLARPPSVSTHSPVAVAVATERPNTLDPAPPASEPSIGVGEPERTVGLSRDWDDLSSAFEPDPLSQATLGLDVLKESPEVMNSSETHAESDDVVALEAQASQALEAGKYDLAKATLERLARVTTSQPRRYLTLAACADLMLQGRTEEAFYRLREEGKSQLTVSRALSMATGQSLLAKGNLLLAAAAFTAAAAHAAAGDETLARRAAEIRAEAGVDERSLESAVLQASITHYASRLALHPDDERAAWFLDKVQSLHRGAQSALHSPIDALERGSSPQRAKSDKPSVELSLGSVFRWLFIVIFLFLVVYSRMN